MTSELNQILVAKRSDNLSTNLGLPTHNWRSQTRLFKRITVRVWNVLQGWKGSLFSVRGKEVLIKVVAYAIPSYNILRFQTACVRNLTKFAGSSKT